jgi:hypothetical protein
MISYENFKENHSHFHRSDDGCFGYSVYGECGRRALPDLYRHGFLQHQNLFKREELERNTGVFYGCQHMDNMEWYFAN